MLLNQHDRSRNANGCTYPPFSIFHPTVFNILDYLSMLGLKLNHVSKRGPNLKLRCPSWLFPWIQKNSIVFCSNQLNLWCWDTSLKSLATWMTENPVNTRRFLVITATNLNDQNLNAHNLKRSPNGTATSWFFIRNMLFGKCEMINEPNCVYLLVAFLYHYPNHIHLCQFVYIILWSFVFRF